jgi:hypothetical protein
MAVKRLEPAAARASTLLSLGLDPEQRELDSPEVYSSLVRRAASFLCPASRRALVRAVVEAILPLSVASPEALRAGVEGSVESVIACGDLVESPTEDMGMRRRTLFLGPPAFVAIGDGYILLGVRGDGAPLVSDHIESIDHRGHVRLLRGADPARRDALISEGLIELRSEQWLRAPRLSSPNDLVGLYNEHLAAAGSASAIEGLRILDSRADPRYYRGRWREPKAADAGRFVCRRPKAFGSALWCWAELVGGEVTALVDLPIRQPLARGCDEAWHLQAALDSVSERPQRMRVRTDRSATGAFQLDIFSPLPSWAQRRLEMISTSVTHMRGALMSYRLGADELDEEINFLKDTMWLIEDEELSPNVAKR